VADGYVPIGKLFNVEKGQLQSTKCTPGVFDFITAAEGWKTHHDYDHECEALIFAAAASGSLGRTHYVDGKFISSDLCFILTPKDEEKYPLNLQFYHFVFNSLRQTLVAATKSGTSKESINQTNFKKYELPYFDIEQQNSWIEKLKSTMIRKDLLGCELIHQQTLLKKLRQQILQEAIEGKLTADWREKNPDVEPAIELLARIKAEKEQLIKDKKIKNQKSLPPITDEEKPFDLPSGWEFTFLANCSINKDEFRVPVTKSDRNRREKIYNYYGASGVIDKIDDFTHEGRHLLIGEDGANLISRTTPVAFFADGKFWVNNHAHVLASVETITLDYLRIHINAIDLKPYISGGFQPKLSQTNLNRVMIALPPISEQKVIVTKVEEIFAICNQLESQITNNQTHAEQLMQAVLKEAFSSHRTKEIN